MGEKVNARRLAKIADVSTRTITVWRAAGMPIHEDKGRGREVIYDTGAVIAWLLTRDSASGKPDSALAMARTRLVESHAALHEMELAKKRGEYVETRLAERAWAAMVLACRSRLLAIPSRLSLQVVACSDVREVHGILQAAIHEALEELAETKEIETGGTT